MEQQRNRRYKSWFQTNMSMGEKENPPQKKITSSIFTPGTIFMQKLCIYMKNTFYGNESKYRVQQIILATPDEPGEGEHKLYDHLRKNPTILTNVAIYGLDADLIMLSLFHLSYTNNIYVLREAPEFMKSSVIIDIKPSTKEIWALDIAQFGRSIANDMACSYPDNHRMYDYVFLCFLLGNDFLPHFPAACHFTTYILTTCSCSLSLYLQTICILTTSSHAAPRFICRQYTSIQSVPGLSSYSR